MEEEDIWQEVVEELDERLAEGKDGDGMKDGIVALQTELEEDKNKTKHQLKLLESLTKQHIDEHSTHKLLTKTQEVMRQVEKISKGVRQFVEGAEDDFEGVEEALKELRLLQMSGRYLLVVKKVEEESSSIQTCLSVDNTLQAINHFKSLLSLTQQLNHTQCTSLLSYCEDTVVYWYNILFTALNKRMLRHTKSLKWPFIVTTQQHGNQGNKSTGDADNDVDLDDLATVVKLLCRIQLASSYNDKVKQLLSFHRHHHPPLSLPLQVLLAPFDVRFLFHFHGNKKTNSIEKPEWYFTQLVVWFNDHHNFITTTLQPAFPDNVNVLQEFVSGLCCIASNKLKSDLQQLTNNNSNKRISIADSGHNKHNNDHNNSLIAHHIDQALAFYTEMSSNFPSTSLYSTSISTNHHHPTTSTSTHHISSNLHHPSTTTTHPTTTTTHPTTTTPSPSCLSSVLTDECFFPKWLSLEKDYALKKMDMMFETDDAWFCRQAGGSDDDKAPHAQGIGGMDYKIPQFAEQFLFLLVTILDRYRNLPRISSQLDFVDLHLELIDDFRIRLIQLRKQAYTQTPDVTGDDKHASIINTASFVVDLLKSWNNKPLFTRLNYHKKKLEGYKNDDCGEGLWENMVQLYERMGVDMGAEVVGCVLGAFKTLSREYIKDKWLALPSHKQFISMSLSTSACAMLNQLKIHLQHMQLLLNKTLFESLWQDVASALDNFIFEEIILHNHFNEGGAMQLHHDMTRNLFPIFHYTNKPENYFANVKEACQVLTMTPGSALLIRDVLKRALHPLENSKQVTDPVAALFELGVHRLIPEVVYQLISLRIDLQYG